MRRSKRHLYSITLSARMRIAGEMVMPIAFRHIPDSYAMMMGDACLCRDVRGGEKDSQ
jgi:hypothetical protein